MWLLKASSRQIDSETLLMRLPAFIAAHAGVALIGGAAGEDHRVGGRHMSVGPDEERDAAVDVVAGGHLLRGRLGMEIKHRGIDRGAEAVARPRRGASGGGVVGVLHEQRDHGLSQPHLVTIGKESARERVWT